MKINLLLMLCVLTSACSPNYPVLLVEPDADQATFYEDGVVHCVSEDSMAIMDVVYIADAGAYIIFEVNFQNHSDDIIYIDHDQFQLHINPEGEEEDLSSESFSAIDPIEYIAYLESIQDEERDYKESNTIWASVLTGVEIVAAAVTPGVGLATSVAIAADRGVDIAYARENSNSVIRSIDDEIGYMASRVLDETRIPPGEHITYDILFEPVPFPGDLHLAATIENTTYDFDFVQRIEMRSN